MPNATFVKKNRLGQLSQYIFQVPNITQTVTEEMTFVLDNTYGTFEGIKLSPFNAGNTVTITPFIYERSGISTPTIYSIYEGTASNVGGQVFQTGLTRPFINNDDTVTNKIYGKFRNTVNTATLTMTVAFYIKE